MRHEEAKLQASCVRWFRMQYPKYRKLLFSSLNGVVLKGTPEQRARTWNRLKEEGAVTGVADLFLSVPSGDLAGLYIETKTPRGKQSQAQKEFEAAVLEAGYGYAMPRDFEEFSNIVKNYLKSGEY